jgi:hypothetical protein
MPQTTYASSTISDSPAIQRDMGLFLPKTRSVTIQCFNVNDRTTYRQLRFGAGILHYTANCYITSDEIQIFPELYGETQTALETSKLYLPAKTPVITVNKIQKHDEILPSELKNSTTQARKLLEFNELLMLVRSYIYTKFIHSEINKYTGT